MSLSRPKYHVPGLLIAEQRLEAALKARGYTTRQEVLASRTALLVYNEQERAYDEIDLGTAWEYGYINTKIAQSIDPSFTVN